MSSDACHMSEEVLPWIRVSRSDLRECVFTHQIEGEMERDESKEICVNERQPGRSKCFDKFSECR